VSTEQGTEQQGSFSRNGSFSSPSSPFQHLARLDGQTTHSKDLGEAGLQLMRTQAGACEVPEGPLVYKQWHSNVSVLFADICGYTAMTQQVEPDHTMLMLHELFSKYDNLCSQFGVYKVETIGDCYMACCGLLTDDADHAERLVEFGIRMLAVAASVVHPLGNRVRIRVGVYSGRVMSGIVGSTRARYCLFGDTGGCCSCLTM
jgi:class 3 adenylate cyclase